MNNQIKEIIERLSIHGEKIEQGITSFMKLSMFSEMISCTTILVHAEADPDMNDIKYIIKDIFKYRFDFLDDIIKHNVVMLYEDFMDLGLHPVQITWVNKRLMMTVTFNKYAKLYKTYLPEVDDIINQVIS